MGRLLPLGGVPPLTVFDLFFNAGGTETVRGYSEDELSAYDFLGFPWVEPSCSSATPSSGRR